MGLTVPTLLSTLRTKVYKSWQTALDATPTWSDPFFTNIDSTTNVNTYGWMGEIGDMREWIGPRAVEGLSERAYQIFNKTYEKTVGVPRDKLEDSDIADAGIITAQMAERGKKLPDLLLKDLLQNGHLSTAVAYDGQNFFDTDHPQVPGATGGTQSNYFTSTPLTAANFRAVRAAMFNYKGEAGRTIAQIGQLYLVVPPALEGAGEDIVNVSTLANGADNTNQGKAKLMVIPDLAGQDTTWYEIWLGGALGPFIKQNRRPLALTTKTSMQEDNVFWENEFIWGTDVRVGAGYGLWQRAAKAVA